MLIEQQIAERRDRAAAEQLKILKRPSGHTATTPWAIRRLHRQVGQRPNLSGGDSRPWSL